MKHCVHVVGLGVLSFGLLAGGESNNQQSSQSTLGMSVSNSVRLIGGDPRTLFASSGDSRLFATSFNQGIVELNPATGELLNILEPPIDISVFDAMAFDGASLFLLNHGSDPDNIYEIDPDTGGVLARHAITESSFVHGMAVLDNHLYLSNSALNDIVIYSLSSDSIVGRLDIDEVNPDNPDANLSGGLGAITTGGAGLIASTAGDAIVEIDPVSGQIVNSFAYTGFPLGGDIGLGVVNGEIFVGNNTGSSEQIVVYSRNGSELRKLTVEGSIGIQSIGADDAVSQVTARATLFFAQYADGAIGGINNPTRVFLVADDQPESGEVHFLDPDGAPEEVGIGGEMMSIVPFDLSARGALEIVTDGTGNLKNGPVEIYSDLGVTSQLKAGIAYDFLGFSVSVTSSPPQMTYLGYVNFDQSERTAIAVYNPSRSHALGLTLTLVGAEGNQVDVKTLNLGAGEQKAVFLDDPILFADSIEGDFRGTLRIDSEELPFVPLSLIQKRATGALVAVGLD